MSRYAVVENDQIVNVVLVEEGGDYPTEGLLALDSELAHVGIGWSLVGDEWVAPEPSEPEPEIDVDYLRYQEYIKPGGADSLYMKWQRGEASEQDWLDEIERVRQLFRLSTHEGTWHG